MAGIKPNDFLSLASGLTGLEEIYTQLNDNPRKFTVDDVKDYIENNISAVTDYSFTETDTGRKWVNGKPVYEIVIDVANNILPNGVVVHNLKIDRYLDIRLLGSVEANLTRQVSGAGTNNTDISAIDTETVSLNEDISNQYKYMILEYTKLID